MLLGVILNKCTYSTIVKYYRIPTSNLYNYNVTFFEIIKKI